MYENWRGYNKHKPDANENNVNSREKKWIWQFWIDK